jgi:HEAT repeat protein
MNANEEPRVASSLAEIKQCAPAAWGGGIAGVTTALLLRRLGIGVDFYGPVVEVLCAWGAVCGLGVTAAFGRCSRKSLLVSLLAGAGLSVAKLYLELSDFGMLAVVLCLPAIIWLGASTAKALPESSSPRPPVIDGVVPATESLAASEASRKVRPGRDHARAERAVRRLSRSQNPRSIVRLVRMLPNSDARQALAGIGAPAILRQLCQMPDIELQDLALGILAGAPPSAEVSRMANLLQAGWYESGWFGRRFWGRRLRLGPPPAGFPWYDPGWILVLSALAEGCVLSEIGEPVFGRLVALLEEGPKNGPFVRTNAIAVLTQVATADATRCLAGLLRKECRVEELLEAASKGDQDSLNWPSTIVRALRSLGWQAADGDDLVVTAIVSPESALLPGSPAARRLIPLLKSERYSVRLAAARMLEPIGDPLAAEPFALALHGEAELRGVALKALERIGPAATIPLGRTLAHPEPDVRKAMVEILGRIDPAGVSGLGAAIKDPDPGVREAALKVLVGKEKNSRVIGLLQTALEDPAVRLPTAEMLVPRRDVYAAPPLFDVLTRALQSILGQEKEEVRLKFAMLIEDNHPERGHSPLAEALRDPIGKAQEAALKPLIAALNDSDWLKREAAAYSLGRLGAVAKPALEPLIRALDDPPRPSDVSGAKECIRKAAALAIGQLGDIHEQLTELVRHGDIKVRKGTVELLGSSGDARALDLLLEAIRDQDQTVRWDALWAIKKSGDPRALDRVCACLAERLLDSNRELQREAESALARIGGPRALGILLPHLSEMLRDQSRRTQGRAESVLKEIGREGALELLFAHLLLKLRSGNNQLQMEALDTLAQIVSGITEPRAVEMAVSRLLAMVRDDNRDVRLGGVIGLGSSVRHGRSSLGTPAVDALIAALKDNDPRVVQKAADTLGGWTGWSPSDEMKRTLWAAGVLCWPPPPAPSPRGRWYSRLGAWLGDLLSSPTSTSATRPGSYRHHVH